MNIYFCIIQFFIAFFIVLLYYKFVETKDIKRFSKNNMPVDLKLFINMEHIDVKKISHKKLMRIVAIINAVDVGIVLLITNITENFLLKFLLSVPSIFVVLFFSYKIVGFVMKKKGLTKDES